MELSELFKTLKEKYPIGSTILPAHLFFKGSIFILDNHYFKIIKEKSLGNENYTYVEVNGMFLVSTSYFSKVLYMIHNETKEEQWAKIINNG